MSEMVLVITAAGRRAALPALEVSAVVELASVTPVPCAPRHIVGLAALRSRPLTVIDCGAALGADGSCAASGRRRAVVVEHESHLYGLLVAAADDIVAIRGEPSPLGADPGPAWARVATGWVETEVGALPLLDIARLIDEPGDFPPA